MNVRNGYVRTAVLLAGVAIALGARGGERPVPVEPAGDATGNVVALSLERTSGDPEGKGSLEVSKPTRGTAFDCRGVKR